MVTAIFQGHVQRKYDRIYFSSRQMIGEELNASHIQQEVASTALQFS
jgi:hypothetical protein